MACNLCGEEYMGMAGDCACTMYGYTEEEDIPAELIGAYRRGRSEKARRELRYKAWRNTARAREIAPWVWAFLVGLVIGWLLP